MVRSDAKWPPECIHAKHSLAYSVVLLVPQAFLFVVRLAHGLECSVTSDLRARCVVNGNELFSSGAESSTATC
jgi:hypothetical protein